MNDIENLELHVMTISDLDSIADLLESKFDDFWNYNILKEELQADNSKYIVAKNSITGKILGFAGIKIILDDAEIMNIVTRKDFRNLGIGSKLLSYLIDICTSLNLNSIFLEVHENNKIAQNLYNKYGFKNIYLRKNYYNNNAGIIMKKVLKTS